MGKDARIRLRQGERELELEGPVDWVETQLARWAPHVLADAPPPEPATQVAIKVAEPELPRVSPDFRPQVRTTLDAFMTMKNATGPADMLITAVYYMEKYLQQETFTVEALQEQLAALPAWACLRADEVMEEAQARGHVEKLRDGRWTITYKGQNYVRDGLV